MGDDKVSYCCKDNLDEHGYKYADFVSDEKWLKSVRTVNSNHTSEEQKIQALEEKHAAALSEQSTARNTNHTAEQNILDAISRKWRCFDYNVPCSYESKCGDQLT